MVIHLSKYRYQVWCRATTMINHQRATIKSKIDYDIKTIDFSNDMCAAVLFVGRHNRVGPSGPWHLAHPKIWLIYDHTANLPRQLQHRQHVKIM